MSPSAALQRYSGHRAVHQVVYEIEAVRLYGVVVAVARGRAVNRAGQLPLQCSGVVVARHGKFDLYSRPMCFCRFLVGATVNVGLLAVSAR